MITKIFMYNFSILCFKFLRVILYMSINIMQVHKVFSIFNSTNFKNDNFKF